MSFVSPGGYVPLFDKLAWTDGCATSPTGSTLSIDGVEGSVERELARLLGSRSRIPLSEFADARLTVLDYGIPDYTGCFLQNEEDCSLLKASIRRAIETFESRLTNIEISLKGNATGTFIASIGIAATLQLAATVRRVSFMIDTGYHSESSFRPAAVTEPA